jgi:hypothetical protein
MDWTRTKLSEKYGLKRPLIQSPVPCGPRTLRQLRHFEKLGGIPCIRLGQASEKREQKVLAEVKSGGMPVWATATESEILLNDGTRIQLIEDEKSIPDDGLFMHSIDAKEQILYIKRLRELVQRYAGRICLSVQIPDPKGLSSLMDMGVALVQVRTPQLLGQKAAPSKPKAVSPSSWDAFAQASIRV